MDESKEILLAIKHVVEVMDAKITALQDQHNHLHKDVNEIKNDVAVLKEDVAVLKEDVATLKVDVAILKVDVAILKDDVAVLKEDVAELKVGQQRQDRILESLALHSLEQETIIRELKRIK
jgi:septal ring factor EnvC (AmiA/AmiB activator)